jgi:glycosyltransferase 2 family protein
MRRYAIAIRERMGSFGSNRLKWLVTGLMVVFSAVFFGWMFWHYYPTLAAYKWKLQILPLVLGFPIYSLDLLMAVLGWSAIMRQLGYRLALKEHVRIFCMTRVAGRIPGAPWHVVGRVALYKPLGVSVKITSVGSGLEMILIIVSGIISSALIGFSLPEHLQKYLPWMGLILVIGLVLLHPSVVTKVLLWLRHNELTVKPRYRDMLLLVALYVMIWVVGGCVLYMMILAVYPLPWTQIAGVIGAWGLSGAVASLLSLSPTSFGIKEIALSLLLALFIPTGLALIISILIRLYLTAAEFVWAIIASRL